MVTFVESNMRSLRRNYSDYAGVLTAMPEGARYVFKPAGSSVACRDPFGRWLHGPEDPWRAAQLEAARMVVDDAELYVVLRPGLGYQAFAILQAIEKNLSGSLVLLVEDRLDLFKATLSVVDWAPLLDSTCAVLLLGNPQVVISSFFERHAGASLLPTTLVLAPEMADDRECQQLAVQLGALSCRAREFIEGQLEAAGRSLEERRARREPLRVFLAGLEHGYLTGPLADGFRACGCDVDVQTGDARLPRNLRAQQWVTQFASRPPDVIVWTNRPELSGLASDALRALGVANVLWSVDSPRRMRLTRSELSTVDLHLCFDAQHLSAYAELGARRCERLPLAAGLRPLPGCGPSDEVWPPRLGPQMSFVGALGELRIGELREALRRRDPEHLALLDALASEPGDPAPAFEQKTGRPYEGTPCFYIDEVRTQRRRLDVLSRLPLSLLKIFGGVDWARADSPLASAYGGRGILYGFDLASTYYHSHINLNVFHEQCIDSTNSRVYDVLAAGGFLLTEYRPCLESEFDVGAHLATFSTPDEAAEKVEYFLAHPAEREAIARAGQRHVLAHHTFAARCRRLLELVHPFIGRGNREKVERSDCEAGP